jgi:hypothetical protein
LNQGVSTYRFAPALLVRMLAAALMLGGILVALAALLVWLLGAPTVVLSVAVLLAALLAAGAGLVSTRVGAPILTVVRFDDTGYRVRLLRSAGVRQGRWSDVEDVVTATLSGHECVVLRMRDGRTTTVPVDVLATTPRAFLADLEAHLDAAHGYRRLGKR